jgi:hypothetical protein
MKNGLMRESDNFAAGLPLEAVYSLLELYFSLFPSQTKIYHGIGSSSTGDTCQNQDYQSLRWRQRTVLNLKL